MTFHATTASRTGGASAPEALDARSQLRVWLEVLDALLRAIEQTVWQVRTLGEQTFEAAQHTQSALTRLLFDSRSFAEDSASRVGRLTGTAFTLGRVLAGYRLHTMKAAFMSRSSAARARERLHEQSARKLYELCVRQGGALLKVAQILSARPDLLPRAYIRELGRLQDAAPPVSLADIMRMVESELGAPIEELFEVFDPEPLASASIGQVHRATLRDGREVAVKVQRPYIARLVGLDLELLEHFARALAETLPPIDMETIIRETRSMIAGELDYVSEAANTERVAAFFAEHPHIRAPRVIAELSTKRVLVTELMAGEKISHVLDRALADDAQRGRITSLLSRVLEAYVRQTLELGLFQADPHPGNLLATEDDGLVLLDFGCAKQLSPEERAALVALAGAFVARDAKAMGAALEGLGFATQSGTRRGLECYAETVLEELGLARARGGDWPTQLELLAQASLFSRFIAQDPVVKLPEAFVMLGRVFGTLSGLFLHYRPDVDAALRVMPLVLLAMMNQRNATPAPAQT